MIIILSYKVIFNTWANKKGLGTKPPKPGMTMLAHHHPRYE